jgi:putative FmdB family regulatory protein
MPIYEYQALDPDKGCTKCVGRFEVIQLAPHELLSLCPACGQKVVKLISWCRAVATEYSEAHNAIKKRISAYEKEGMWSHAAELADEHSEKIKDSGMKFRAIDNYEKAGYDAKTLEKHAKTSLPDRD